VTIAEEVLLFGDLILSGQFASGRDLDPSLSFPRFHPLLQIGHHRQHDVLEDIWSLLLVATKLQGIYNFRFFLSYVLVGPEGEVIPHIINPRTPELREKTRPVSLVLLDLFLKASESG